MARFSTPLIAAAACLLCVACPSPERPPPRPQVPLASASASPAAAAADPTLRWAISEPSAIIPIDATTPDDVLVVDALYDSLTSWSESLAVQPAAALRWTRNGSATTWRFTLRRSGRFSDGTRVTAGHFVRTWNALARTGRAHHHLQDVVGYGDVRSGRRTALEGVRALDARTLQVRLTRPVAEFPSVVAHPALAPMVSPPSTAAERDMPIGNGSFRMAEPWVHGRFVRLRRTAPPRGPDGDGSTPVHEVVFQISDPASAYIAFEQGGVDVATVPPVAFTADEPPATPTTRYRGPGLLRGDLPSTYFLVCNTQKPPCAGRQARRGLALAVDRRRTVADAFYRSAAPGWTVVPPAVPAHRQRTCLYCVHDPARARQLLESAGVERTRLWISKGGDHERVARRLEADLLRAGVSVRVKAVAFDTFFRALREGRSGLFRFGWTLDYPTGDNALRPLFHSQGRVNYARYRRPAVDALLDAASRSTNPARRTAAYRKAEDLIVGRDQAVIPIVALRRRTVVAERIRDLVYGPMGTADLSAVRILERAEGE